MTSSAGLASDGIAPILRLIKVKASRRAVEQYYPAIASLRRLDMDTVGVSALAHHLFETQGLNAVVQAAQKAVSFEKAGDQEQAKMWRQVEAVLREMRGANQS